MRLAKIKIAGFKSFVDPTTINLPSNLMGIVGPNGCGKSNVIDAVRWVMGESSAKHLRGESMADVIFNGSIGRTDFPRGDYDTLIQAITTKLWPLGKDVTFFPGHGPTSTFGDERQTNPYVSDSVTGLR